MSLTTVHLLLLKALQMYTHAVTLVSYTSLSMSRYVRVCIPHIILYNSE